MVEMAGRNFGDDSPFMNQRLRDLRKAQILKWLKQTSAKCFQEAVKADKRENVCMADALFGASTKLDKAIHYLLNGTD